MTHATHTYLHKNLHKSASVWLEKRYINIYTIQYNNTTTGTQPENNLGRGVWISESFIGYIHE